jgi:hypothetical protein
LSRGGITPRWAKPVIPLSTEEVGKRLLFGGTIWHFVQFTLKHDDVERVRLGYVCIHCLQPHEQHYPLRCEHCGFPIRAIQDQVFEAMYEGEERVGPSTSLAEEWERAQEMVERGSFP